MHQLMKIKITTNRLIQSDGDIKRRRIGSKIVEKVEHKYEYTEEYTHYKAPIEDEIS